MQMLSYSKNLKQAYHFQAKHQWQFEALLNGKFDLTKKTLAIIGLGSIGRRVAKLAKAFDMKVIGTVNDPRAISFVDKVYPPSKLAECLKRADFILLSVPLTDKTYHLLGAEQFSIMKKSVYLINIGRGKLIDEPALTRALESQKISGVALDVFEQEPLSADSSLWDIKQASVTPHYSGMAENIWEKLATLFCVNALRFRNGQRLLGTIDKKKGY
jgi:phosphoglycerate dehydrogenase-like enzyme